MQQITARFQLEEALQAAQTRAEEVAEALKLAKYNLRECNTRSTEYDGSLRGLLDRLSGRREEKAEQLRRELGQAEAALSALTLVTMILFAACTVLYQIF